MYVAYNYDHINLLL